MIATESWRPDRHFAVAAAAVLIASAATAAPMFAGDLLERDGYLPVVDDTRVDELSASNAARAFSDPHLETYRPLALVSYMIDGSLWSGSPRLCLAHNLLLYLGALALVLALLRRLGFTDTAAALGALLFGLAPHHAVAVGWIAGRGEVLALLLALGSWHVHLGTSRTAVRRALREGISALLLAAALLSSPAALPVPAMIWITDALLLGRRPLRSLAALAGQCALAAAAAAAAIWSWASQGAGAPAAASGLLGRIELIGWSLAHYLGTALWPFDLSVVYARPGETELVAGGAAGLGATVIVAAVLLVAHRRGRQVGGWVAASLWLLVALLPFLNLLPLEQLVADRRLLVPSLAVALVGALAGNTALRLERVDRRVMAGAGILLIAAAWGMSRAEEFGASADSETIWEQLEGISRFSDG
ncbi:MAG: hypothetical protein R6V85_15315 [Polyangia bacterium]